MAEANKTSREIARSNSCVFPRDLLQRFISNSAEGEDGEEEEEEEDEEIELNLGLSLGGRFGVDRSSKLVRSSSVVVTMPLFRETHHQPETKPAETAVARPRHTGLIRTTSLPAESEEEWRKRKEMQTLRRMAAKRRRSEKLRTGGGNSIKSAEADNNNNNNNPGEAAAATSRRRGRPSSGLPRWSATANKGGLLRQHSAGHDSLQGSLESQGGGGGVGSSLSVSEMETKSHQATSEEARSIPSTLQQKEAITKPTTRLRRLSSVEMKIEPQQGKGKSEMPCVFTKGDGPNGKRVDGILYRYGNGEEVRIMCVCHGDFLSPADFVKHAGGPHVDHPLRHIVVNTSSPSNLL
ncbi:unnamed protein product [Eruca vesicaria subsp. sativa]|uniref:Ninja-family protein n=1 Tax=Eruca vesicaria subsp. sativa TaxID=29727 RepID=A0ABC8K612_ERUVS|nr:unnamed protein product [Eruca vesicaria subsp. sativa]